MPAAPFIVAPEPTDWRADAACRDVDLEVFFAPDDASQHEAITICESCPVRAACLDHAIRNREPYGVWGGTREQERRRLVRARGRDAA